MAGEILKNDEKKSVQNVHLRVFEVADDYKFIVICTKFNMAD